MVCLAAWLPPRQKRATCCTYTAHVASSRSTSLGHIHPRHGAAPATSVHAGERRKPSTSAQRTSWSVGGEEGRSPGVRPKCHMLNRRRGHRSPRAPPPLQYDAPDACGPARHDCGCKGLCGGSLVAAARAVAQGRRALVLQGPAGVRGVGSRRWEPAWSSPHCLLRMDRGTMLA